ncbi:unnamed protein product [Linum tenue]|uniref:Uncharacterized protein n=1 Tax=Linum tenue TaxID=586396 RepID=A0AAV0MMP2_9ROSI|nr:unnamed protein product [Linum tenue]CAI0556564.1 unnamed protein product [Linum tenue]
MSKVSNKKGISVDGVSSKSTALETSTIHPVLPQEADAFTYTGKEKEPELEDCELSLLLPDSAAAEVPNWFLSISPNGCRLKLQFSSPYKKRK